MHLRTPLRRAALAALVMLACAGAALAGETPLETTRIEVTGDDQNTEVVNLDAMQLGEVRAIVTEGGTPAVVTRTEAGVRLELRNEIHEIVLADGAHDVDHLVHHRQLEQVDGAGPAHRVVIRRDQDAAAHGEAGERRVIVKRHIGDAPLSEAELAAEIAELESLALAEAGPVEPGKNRIRVIRTVKRVDGTE